MDPFEKVSEGKEDDFSNIHPNEKLVHNVMMCASDNFYLLTMDGKSWIRDEVKKKALSFTWGLKTRVQILLAAIMIYYDSLFS